MAELSDQIKEGIVIQLARFRRPAEVAVWVREEFGLDLGDTAVQQIVKYDPSRPAFEAGEKWRPIFEAAREDYLTNVKAVPVANQGYRLMILQKGIDDAVSKKNWRLAADLSEQAAKEVGGVLTNTRELNVNNNARTMSSEDRAAALGALLSEALDKRKQQAMSPGSATAQ